MDKHIKVNLTLDETSENGEGVWCICQSEEDKKKHDSDISGEKITVILDNSPVSWKKVGPGDEIVVVLNGKNRPVARLSDNPGYIPDEVGYMRIKKKLLGGRLDDDTDTTPDDAV